MLKFRLTELKAQKERTIGRRLPWAEISQEIGVSPQVLSNLSSPARPAITNHATLEALCRYFNCTLEQLLEFDPPLGAEVSCHVDELYPERRRSRREQP